MKPASRRARAFVRALLPHGEAALSGGTFVVKDGGRARSLDPQDVRDLITAGVLVGDENRCRPLPDARSWLRRATLDADAFAAQHRLEATGPHGTVLNLAESPLARLGRTINGQAPFLARHHLEAGERVQRLAERAQLRPRVTMSYSAAHTAGGRGQGHAVGISLMAAEARKELGQIVSVLPSDCSSVVIDVCALHRGLQEVEAERRWPRRSAKLVLRIGLEHLAQHFGLDAQAVGREMRRSQYWLEAGARPDRFDD